MSCLTHNKLPGDCFNWESRSFCFLCIFNILSNNLILKGQQLQGCVIGTRTHSDVEMIKILRVDYSLGQMCYWWSLVWQEVAIFSGQKLQGPCSENLSSTSPVNPVSPIRYMSLFLDQSKKAMKIWEPGPYGLPLGRQNSQLMNSANCV